MADVTTIELTTAPRFKMVANQTIAWVMLLGAEWLSHWAFGGSWIIDLWAFIVMVLLTVLIGSRWSGWTAAMTPEELRRWVDDGMPRDVKAWRAANAAKPVAARRVS